MYWLPGLGMRLFPVPFPLSIHIRHHNPVEANSLIYVPRSGTYMPPYNVHISCMRPETAPRQKWKELNTKLNLLRFSRHLRWVSVLSSSPVLYWKGPRRWTTGAELLYSKYVNFITNRLVICRSHKPSYRKCDSGCRCSSENKTPGVVYMIIKRITSAVGNSGSVLWYIAAVTESFISVELGTKKTLSWAQPENWLRGGTPNEG